MVITEHRPAFGAARADEVKEVVVNLLENARNAGRDEGRGPRRSGPDQSVGRRERDSSRAAAADLRATILDHDQRVGAGSGDREAAGGELGRADRRGERGREGDDDHASTSRFNGGYLERPEACAATADVIVSCCVSAFRSSRSAAWSWPVGLGLAADHRLGAEELPGDSRSRAGRPRTPMLPRRSPGVMRHAILDQPQVQPFAHRRRHLERLVGHAAFGAAARPRRRSAPGGSARDHRPAPSRARARRRSGERTAP